MHSVKSAHEPIARGVAAALCALAAAAAGAQTARAPATADAEQLEAARTVYYGAYRCELSQEIRVDASADHPGYVELQHGRKRTLMKPVRSATGALRLEDVQGRTFVVQIASKSMLMDAHAGRRLVDGCVSEQQRAQAEAAPEADAGSALGVAALPSE